MVSAPGFQFQTQIKESKFKNDQQVGFTVLIIQKTTDDQCVAAERSGNSQAGYRMQSIKMDNSLLCQFQLLKLNLSDEKIPSLAFVVVPSLVIQQNWCTIESFSPRSMVLLCDPLPHLSYLHPDPPQKMQLKKILILSLRNNYDRSSTCSFNSRWIKKMSFVRTHTARENAVHYVFSWKSN